MLQTEPSFSIYNDQDFEEGINDGKLVKSITIGNDIGDIISDDFSFGKMVMGIIKEDDDNEDRDEKEDEEFEEGSEPVSPMYLAAGLGIADVEPSNFDENGDVEAYYKSLLEEYPSNPLVLRNYAQILQCKGDLRGAEEYYSRAVLADCSDGEIISQYANFIWQLHHDQDKASSYFKRAVQASPGDSNVLAAYARFLWETVQ
ncbi:hypothetical protein RND71_020592 [Anisodus tanguticus]|uniref:Uncharacterized protein n=1 Tax=Anisodus tanguticus TaxID=243964 RepID=A0AAE1S1C8_9SOLA|nr:hypothetical protein RND71_020592 [Anisodus tanguticus]